MGFDESLTTEVKELALAGGADLVGIASIDRFDNVPPEVHPRLHGPPGKNRPHREAVPHPDDRRRTVGY